MNRLETIYYKVFPYEFSHAINPKTWHSEAKYFIQRGRRGWSDRDTWGAGEHIAKMTAEMLQHLDDNGHTDWPEWFKLNIQEKGSYKDLQSVVDDINNYLEFGKTGWSDKLDIDDRDVKDWAKKTKDGNYEFKSTRWIDKETGKRLTNAEINSLIKEWQDEKSKLYKKATGAMIFFSKNFAGFWD